MRRLAYLRNLADQIAAADRDWSAEIEAATTDDELMAIWGESDRSAEISALIKARHEAIAAVTA